MKLKATAYYLLAKKLNKENKLLKQRIMRECDHVLCCIISALHKTETTIQDIQNIINAGPNAK